MTAKNGGSRVDMKAATIKETIRQIVPQSILEILYALKYNRTRSPNTPVVPIYLGLLKEKAGIEIGGPSAIFGTILPIYRLVSSLDGVNFSNKTMWEGSIEEGNTFNYFESKTGKQFIADATDLRIIESNAYDFLLSSNCLEHVANPLKALEEWVRVVVPNGYVLLVLPNKKSNFDHRRPITSFGHLLEDYENNITEHDLTHLNEILELHDLSRDPLAGNYENFKARSLNNFSNRGLHHHVFDLPLIERMFKHFNVSLIHSDATNSDYFALGKVIKSAAGRRFRSFWKRKWRKSIKSKEST